MTRALRITVTIILTVLGAASVFMASSVIFDWFGIREIEGHYVSFVVYANLVCGLIYLVAAFRMIQKKSRVTSLLVLATGILVITSVAFAIYIQQGGVHEGKTIYALSFRTGITAAMAWLSHFIYRRMPLAYISGES